LSRLNAVAARVGCLTGTSASSANPLRASSKVETNLPPIKAVARSLKVTAPTRTPSGFKLEPRSSTIPAAKSYIRQVETGTADLSAAPGQKGPKSFEVHELSSTELERSKTNIMSAKAVEHVVVV
jgi:hypothetical protein